MLDKPKKSKILVVDESISVQKLVHLTFADTDLEVIVALDGYDVMQKVKSLKPDVVLLDSQISGVGEQSLLESLKGDENYRQLRVIAFFSGSERDFLQKFSSFKPDGLLRKPFDARDLKEVVFGVLDEEPTLVKTKTIKTSATQTIVLAEESAVEEQTRSTVVTSNPAGSEPSVVPIAIQQLSSDELKQIARVEIQKWIQENLSPVAEGLLKAEIERIVSK